MPISLEDLNRLLRDEEERININTSDIFYESLGKRLTVKKFIADRDISITCNKSLNFLHFEEGDFKTLYIDCTSDDTVIQLSLTDCKIETLVVFGDPLLSLEIVESLGLKQITVLGSLFELNLSGREVIEKVHIKATESSSSITQLIRKAMFEELQITTLTIEHIQIELQLSDLKIQTFEYFPHSENIVLIHKGSEIKTSIIHGHKGNLIIIDSSVGMLSFVEDQYNNSKVHELSGTFSTSNVKINFLVIEKRASFKKLGIYEKSIVDYLLLLNGSIANVIIDSGQINFLDIDIGNFRFDNLRIINDNLNYKLVINELIFRDGVFAKGLNGNNAVIQLESLEVSSISFISFINQGNFYASGIVGNSVGKAIIVDLIEKSTIDYINTHGYSTQNTFKILNSDLGKINFISCKFKSMRMYLEASKITEIFLAGTDMPKEMAGEIQVGYAQLKKVYENRGDSVQSNNYLARELDAHFQSLKKKNKTEKRSVSDSIDYLTLFINKYSNNFGTNWVWALFGLITTVGIIFVYHNYALGYYIELPLTEISKNNFFEILSLFPEFLFPIHKADFVSEVVKMPVTNLSRFYDYVGRIVSGYYIYQLIQAFRKYGKK